MNENSGKITLGTVICMFIIFVLIISLGIVYYLGFMNNTNNNSSNTLNINNAVKNEPVNISNNEENKSIPLSIDLSTKKVVNSDVADYIIRKSGNISSFHFNIDNGEVSFSTTLDEDTFVRHLGLQDANEIKIKPNFSSQITGFDKKVVDLEIAYPTILGNVYVVFLMEDGTLEYCGIKNLVTNSSTEGKIDGISKAQKLFTCSARTTDGGGTETIVALDNENNLYDIGYILFSKGYLSKSSYGL